MRMEMGNMSKKQQPIQRADNSRKPPKGLQRSEKFPHPVVLSWPLNKIVFSGNGCHTTLKHINKLILKIIQD